MEAPFADELSAPRVHNSRVLHRIYGTPGSGAKRKTLARKDLRRIRQNSPVQNPLDPAI